MDYLSKLQKQSKPLWISSLVLAATMVTSVILGAIALPLELYIMGIICFSIFVVSVAPFLILIKYRNEVTNRKFILTFLKSKNDIVYQLGAKYFLRKLVKILNESFFTNADAICIRQREGIYFTITGDYKDFDIVMRITHPDFANLNSIDVTYTDMLQNLREIKQNFKPTYPQFFKMEYPQSGNLDDFLCDIKNELDKVIEEIISQK